MERGENKVIEIPILENPESASVDKRDEHLGLIEEASRQLEIAGPGSYPPPPDEPSSQETTTAPILDATATPDGATCTNSNTGQMAAKPTSTTFDSSVDTTTASSTVKKPNS